MNEEKAEKIVGVIAQIAAGKAAICLNHFCNNSESAAFNTEAVEKWKRDLVKLLMEL